LDPFARDGVSSKLYQLKMESAEDAAHFQLEMRRYKYRFEIAAREQAMLQYAGNRASEAARGAACDAMAWSKSASAASAALSAGVACTVAQRAALVAASASAEAGFAAATSAVDAAAAVSLYAATTVYLSAVEASNATTALAARLATSVAMSAVGEATALSEHALEAWAVLVGELATGTHRCGYR
jgi:hypothetical protein